VYARVLVVFAALLACGPVTTIDNRGSPEIPRPVASTETVPLEAVAAREAKNCGEARTEVRKAFDRNDDLALARATRTEERLCKASSDASTD
jgi:hypothetical protein